MKITKATKSEKEAYHAADPLNPNPLHGWVKFMGYKLAIEYLGEGNVNWEVLAPKGMIFEGGTHSFLGHTQREILDQLEPLEVDEREVE